MKRKIEEKLIEWKNRKNHKPLIIDGARQIGKTYIAFLLGKKIIKIQSILTLRTLKI